MMKPAMRVRMNCCSVNRNGRSRFFRVSHLDEQFARLASLETLPPSKSMKEKEQVLESVQERPNQLQLRSLTVRGIKGIMGITLAYLHRDIHPWIDLYCPRSLNLTDLPKVLLFHVACRCGRSEGRCIVMLQGLPCPSCSQELKPLLEISKLWAAVHLRTTRATRDGRASMDETARSGSFLRGAKQPYCVTWKLSLVNYI